ncbi:MAG: signal peptidase II [Clostridiales bacterium]|nr:signal peptidase II [Clostridiales bacterium]
MIKVLIILSIVALDQVTKYLAVAHLRDLGTIEIVRGVFSLTYVENRGAAFGILQNQRWFFIVLTIIVCIGIAYFLFTQSNTSLILRISLIMVLGGAIGNLIDRVRLGYVVDMLHFTLIDFPVFNIADCFVVMGTILLAYYILFIGDRVENELV